MNRIELKIWDVNSDELIFHFHGRLQDLLRINSSFEVSECSLVSIVERAQEDYRNFQELFRRT